MFGAKAQTFTINNNTGTYFTGVLHEYLGACSPVSATDYFYDMPDNYSYTYKGGYIDANGNRFGGKVLGISFQEHPGGSIYNCSFCIGGVLNLTGTKTIVAPGGTVVVSWVYTGTSLTVDLF